MAKTGISDKEKEQIAFDLYLNTDKTQKEICAIINWSETTFSKKKNQGNWEELKSAQELTAHKIIANIYRELQQLTDGKNNPKVSTKGLDADKIIKLANAIEKLSNKKVTVSNTINVFKEFTSWLMESDVELAKTVIEKQKLFVTNKINGRSN